MYLSCLALIVPAVLYIFAFVEGGLPNARLLCRSWEVNNVNNNKSPLKRGTMGFLMREALKGCSGCLSLVIDVLVHDSSSISRTIYQY